MIMWWWLVLGSRLSLLPSCLFSLSYHQKTITETLHDSVCSLCLCESFMHHVLQGIPKTGEWLTGLVVSSFLRMSYWRRPCVTNYHTLCLQGIDNDRRETLFSRRCFDMDIMMRVSLITFPSWISLILHYNVSCVMPHHGMQRQQHKQQQCGVTARVFIIMLRHSVSPHHQTTKTSLS